MLQWVRSTKWPILQPLSSVWDGPYLNRYYTLKLWRVKITSSKKRREWWAMGQKSNRFFFSTFIKCLISLCTGNVDITYILTPTMPRFFCCTQRKTCSFSVTAPLSTWSNLSCFLCFPLWLSHGNMVYHGALSKCSCFSYQKAHTTRHQDSTCPY